MSHNYTPCQIEMKLLQESIGEMRELERLGLALDKKGKILLRACIIIAA